MKTLKEVKEKLEDIRGGGVDNKELTRLAIDFIEENTNKKDTENINILIDYVKNKYIYFGNFDKKIIKEFVNKLLEKEIIL